MSTLPIALTSIATAARFLTTGALDARRGFVVEVFSGLALLAAGALRVGPLALRARRAALAARRHVNATAGHAAKKTEEE